MGEKQSPATIAMALGAGVLLWFAWQRLRPAVTAAVRARLSPPS